MGRLWNASEKGWDHEAVACFERGLVWEGFEPGWDHEAVGFYRGHRIWRGAEKGWVHEAVGYYKDGRIWNGNDAGWDHEAVGYFEDNRVWAGDDKGWDHEAVGYFEGSPPGAAAAALLLLLGGGEASESASTTDPQDSEEDESDDDSSDEDSDDDDDYAGYDDSSTYVSAPSVPPPPHDPPEVVAERQLAACTSVAALNAVRQQLYAAGMLTSRSIEKLYLPHAEVIETRRLDDLIGKMNGKSHAQLEREYDEEMRRAIGNGTAVEALQEFESYKLMMLAWLIQQVDKLDQFTLHAFRSWHEEHPFYTILARRRLKDIAAEVARSALAAIEPVEAASAHQLSDFFFRHATQDVAVSVATRVQDKQTLVEVIHHYREWPVGLAAKKRYLELLDEEYARMKGWDKLLYALFRRQRDREI